MRDNCISSADNTLIDSVMKFVTAANHRPLNSDTDDFRQFVKNQTNAVAEFATLHPQIDLSAEIEHWKTLAH